MNLKVVNIKALYNNKVKYAQTIIGKTQKKNKGERKRFRQTVKKRQQIELMKVHNGGKL